jgi:predicted nucleic acid-binding protein
VAVFADTSGLLKLYVAEPGSRWMHQVVRPQQIIISAITTAEIGAALSRRQREGRLTGPQARAAWMAFRRQSRDFLTMPLPPATLRAAARLTARSTEPLRALDAIQLQSALEARADARRSGTPDPIFISADERLLRAAAAVGLATDNPHNHV